MRLAKPIANTALNRFLHIAEEVRESRKMWEEACPFFRLLPAYSETVCGKSLCRIPLIYAGFVNPSPFFRFFRQFYGFTGWPIPSQREKMPVTMPPHKKGARPETPAACESPVISGKRLQR
ncbi:MAG: hypothetical protein ACREFE_18110 [Limisphaerales bacterium]